MVDVHGKPYITTKVMKPPSPKCEGLHPLSSVPGATLSLPHEFALPLPASVPPTIRTAQTNLKIFSAKRKFRGAIHAMIACQQLHGWASVMEGTSSTPVSARETKRAEGGGFRVSGDPRTSGLPSSNATVGGSGSEENRRWTFNTSAPTNRPGDKATSSRSTGYEVCTCCVYAILPGVER